MNECVARPDESHDQIYSRPNIEFTMKAFTALKSSADKIDRLLHLHHSRIMMEVPLAVKWRILTVYRRNSANWIQRLSSVREEQQSLGS